jgi:hypothetical protein
MDGIEAVTCVKFVLRQTEQSYIEIHSGNGCSSQIGRTGNPQKVSLNNRGCMSLGTIQHEFIHALGYHHMHNHEARDQFVRIQWDHVQAEFKHNFQKVDPKFFDNFGTPYDINSVMHYPPKAFSANDQLTIVPMDMRMADAMGQRTGLSDGDIKRINNMYKCGANRQQAFPEHEGGYYQGEYEHGYEQQGYQHGINTPDYTDYGNVGYEQYSNK